jgi:outer membrane protein
VAAALLWVLAVPSGSVLAVEVLTLPGAYAMAIRRFERVRLAGTEVARTQLSPYRALTTLAPTVSLTGTHTREKDEISFGAPGAPPPAAKTVVIPGDVTKGFVRVEQPLVMPQFVPLWRAARRGVEASEEGYAVAVQETAFAVAEAFYGVLRAAADLQVAQESLTLAQDERRRSQLRYEVGELVKADFLRAQVTVARAEQILTAAENTVHLARDVLGRLVGPEVTGELEEPPSPALPAESAGAAIVMAEKDRPDLRRSERLLQAAVEESRRRIAALLPSVVAEWTYRLTSDETFAERNDFWTFLVALRVPLIDRGGALWIDVQEQRYRVEQARLQYEALRRDIRLEVERSWLAADTLTANLVTAQEESRLADETYRLVSQQYDAGTATSLEANTALISRQRARARLVDTRYGHDVAVLALRRATGVLVNDVRGSAPVREMEESHR